MRSEFTLSADEPCVQGHFPGMPLAPGAWLLGRIERTLLAEHPQSQLQSFKKVKFLSPLRPGELAQMHVDESAWPRIKVRISGPDGDVLQATALMV
ncbi:hypothetical protein [Marinimicrobium sp. ABcell2]|uniref:hypothetical protein n=1 Tax=Marinimicrobium sp. ABcell2 TaxID=3069751 RepID=UPI0027B0736F|nr:hypothetical protein [Marinimicrobium sp. ABcell2]MDQ2076991.1 hypothetical protein [Marinimicrobium sp. ABcell2]